MKNMDELQNSQKLDFKSILPVFVIVLIDLLGLTIIIPLLPIYAASFGVNALVIGALGAAYPVMQFFGAPLLGRLSDRFGRRPILLISQIGTLSGFILLGLANSIWLLFVARIIDGISGANISTAQAVITDKTTEETRTQGLGLIGAAFGLGFIIGPIIAFVSLALTDNNYSITAYVAAAFSLISILLTWFLLEETNPQTGESKEKTGSQLGFQSMIAALSMPSVGFLMVLMFFQQVSFGGFEQLLSLFTLSRLGMDATSNAALFVFVGIIVVAVQGYFVGKWSKKFGDRWLILMGLSVLGVGLILSALVPDSAVPWYDREVMEAQMMSDRNTMSETSAGEDLSINLPENEDRGWTGIIWLSIAMVPTAIGGAVLQPSINSLITKNVDKADVGGILGISSSFFSAANAITPLAMGAVFELLGSTYPFLLGGVILMILWLVARPKFKG